jgi:hypothetical protein
VLEAILELIPRLPKYNAWTSGSSCEHEPVLAGVCSVREAVTGAIPGSCRRDVAPDGMRQNKSCCGQPDEEEARKRVESSLVWGEELFLAMAVAMDLDHVISTSGESFVPSRRTFVFNDKAF